MLVGGAIVGFCGVARDPGVGRAIFDSARFTTWSSFKRGRRFAASSSLDSLRRFAMEGVGVVELLAAGLGVAVALEDVVFSGSSRRALEIVRLSDFCVPGCPELGRALKEEG